jgi:copper chaperone CopZ
MNVDSIHVDNIKNDGCVTNIKKALERIPGVTNIAVNKPNSKVTIVYEYGDMRTTFLNVLNSLGYPEIKSEKVFAASF